MDDPAVVPPTPPPSMLEEPFLVPPRPMETPPVPPPPTEPEKPPKKSKPLLIGGLVLFILAGTILSYFALQKGPVWLRMGAQQVYPPTLTPIPPIPTSSPTEKCCSGTKDCPSGQQCVRGGSCGNICVPQPYPLPGCCSDDSQCASWEKCQEGNGACTTNKSCRSQAGCSQDSDCANGAKCSGGTCVGAGILECHATVNGVSIVNNEDIDVSGSVTWFSKKCDSRGGSNCLCGGQPTTESITVSKGATWSRSISGSGCAWQSDIVLSGGWGCSNANAGCISGCGSTPSPIPTVPVAAACVSVAVEIAVPGKDINSLRAGDTISFKVSFLGATQDVAVDLRKGGVSVKSFYAGGPKTTTWTTPSYTIGTTGSYEVMAFIKINGVWK